MSTDNRRRLPWEKFPALTEERLRIVAEMIRDVRHQVVLTHEPVLGDDEWVLGCRAYKRSCYAIAKGAVGEHKAWLSVIEDDVRRLARDTMAPAVLNPELHFVFGIGETPLRFYRGSADEQTDKSLKRRYPEVTAYQAVLDFVGEPEFDNVLRLVVETDEQGEVARVVLVELDADGNPHVPYTIPLDTTAPKVAQFRPQEKERELGAPQVGSKQKKDDEKQSG